MLDCGIKKLPPAAAHILEEPITLDELRQVVTAVKVRKSPGCDGISLEYFQSTWEVIQQDLLSIMNTMYFDRIITDNQKREVIVCIPKLHTPTLQISTGHSHF